MESTAHIMRLHFHISTILGCGYSLSVRCLSIDIVNVKTIPIINFSHSIDSESECVSIMRKPFDRICILRLTTVDWYLNVTMQLNFSGQSAPRCNTFAASVFDQGETLSFFEYQEIPSFYKVDKALFVQYEGDAIPLTDHSNPLFLRDELCESRTIRYVSTTHAVLLVVYLDAHNVRWDDIQLQVMACQTRCQAFTQFPLEDQYRNRVIENNTVTEELLFQLDNMEHTFNHVASLVLAITEDVRVIYGIGFYLRNAQVTYYRRPGAEFFQLVILKHPSSCFVYQYIHDIYYNNWLMRPDYYINLMISEKLGIHGTLASSFIHLHIYRSEIWLDDKTENYKFSKKYRKLAKLENNAHHIQRWTDLKLYGHDFLVELICFPQGEECHNVSSWYKKSSVVIPWHHLDLKTVKQLTYCFQHGSVLIEKCMKSMEGNMYLNLLLDHVIMCLTFSFTSPPRIHYWFAILLHNRALVMSYTNQCIPISYSDQVSITRVIPAPTTISWDQLPDIEIGHSGNPLFESPVIINIYRTLLSVKHVSLCTVNTELSATPMLSLTKVFTPRQNVFRTLDTTGLLSWAGASALCNKQSLGVVEPASDVEERLIIAMLLRNQPISIPIPIFIGPRVSQVG